MNIKTWNIEAMTGYHPITTFYEDFSIAEPFGVSAIIDTYNRAFKEWRDDIKYLTELVMVLNWKIWEHYETHRSLAKVYEGMWSKTTDWVFAHKTGDDLDYFLEITN